MARKMNIMAVVGITATVLFPMFTYAVTTLQFTELMYAPKGPDTKHEWIEVCNTSTSTIPLSQWKLNENKTNHTITAAGIQKSVPPATCAVIADHADIFMTDHPVWKGLLFDSTFSLSNSGETIQLKDTQGNVVDTATYTSALGAQDDGNSLHRSGASFVASLPTPGVESVNGGAVTPPRSRTGNITNAISAKSSHTTTSKKRHYTYQSIKIQPPEAIHARIAPLSQSNAHALTVFHVEVYRETGARADTAVAIWSFGDGATARGRDVRHIYQYAGTYTATVTVTEGTLKDLQQYIVRVGIPQVAVGMAHDGAWVAVENQGDIPLDISSWRIVLDGSSFLIPEHTRIAPQSMVRFPNLITHLKTLRIPKSIRLVYPDATTVSTKSLSIQVPEVSQENTIKKDAITLTVTSTATTTARATPVPQYTQSMKIPKGKRHNTVARVSLKRIPSSQPIVGMRVPVSSRAASPGISTPRDSLPVHTPILISPATRVNAKNVSQTASPASAGIVLSDTTTQHSKQWYWYGALALVLVSATIGLYSVRLQPLTAEGFEIIDGAEDVSSMS